MKSVQELFSVTMSRTLAYIKADFCGKSKSIARLETVGIQLCDAINIVKQTESELSQVQGEVANKVNAKLQIGGNEQELSANDLTLFKYSPITSCDVERSFSRCKVLLSDTWSSFQFDKFKRHVIIQSNTTENEG
jgi:hypothetical protein